MEQCKKCGKKGLFLAVDANQLCESCVLQLEEELPAREALHKKSEEIYDVVQSISATADTIVSLARNGTCDSSVADEIIVVLNTAVEEVKRIIDIVQYPDINNVVHVAEDVEQKIDALLIRSAELLLLAGPPD